MTPQKPTFPLPYLSKVGTTGTDPYREFFFIYRDKFEKSGFFKKNKIKKKK